MSSFFMTLFLFLSQLLPANFAEFELNYFFYGSSRFYYSKDRLDPFYIPPSFSQEYLGGSISAGGYLFFSFSKYFTLDFYIDTGEFLFAQRRDQSGQKFSVFLNEVDLLLSSQEQQELNDALDYCRQQAEKQKITTSLCSYYSPLFYESLFLRELYPTIYFHSSRWIGLSFGFYNKRIARSLIIDNYVIGVHFEADWSLHPSGKSPPLKWEIDAFLPDSSFTEYGKKSPTFHTKLSYILGEDSQIGLSFTYLYDGENLAGWSLLSLWQDFFTEQLNSLVSDSLEKRISLSCYANPSEQELNYLSQALPSSVSQYASSIYFQNCSFLPESRGHHFWLSIDGKWTWQGKVKIEGALAFYASQMTVGLPKEKTAIFPANSQNSSQTNPLTAGSLKNVGRRGREVLFNLPQTTDNNQNNSGQNGDNQTAQSEPEFFAAEKFPLKSFGLSLEFKITYYPIRPFSMAFFFLTATGGSFTSKEQRTLPIFMGISNQLRYTDMFFNNGISTYSAQRVLSSAGVFSKGYITPGLELSYKYPERVELTLVGALFWAYSPPPPLQSESQVNGGLFYGGEIDFRGTLKLLKWLSSVVQFALFFPGDFFIQSSPPPVSFQISVGLDFEFSSI